jgi:hypothetical protein
MGVVAQQKVSDFMRDNPPEHFRGLHAPGVRESRDSGPYDVGKPSTSAFRPDRNGEHVSFLSGAFWRFRRQDYRHLESRAGPVWLLPPYNLDTRLRIHTRDDVPCVCQDPLREINPVAEPYTQSHGLPFGDGVLLHARHHQNHR